MTRKLLLAAAIAIGLTACGNHDAGTSSSVPLLPSKAQSAHGKRGTGPAITFSPNPFVVYGTHQEPYFTMNDADNAAYVTKVDIADKSIIPAVFVTSFAGVYYIDSFKTTPVTPTTIAFTDSDNNQGTLPITIKGSPISTVPTPAFAEISGAGFTYSFTVKEASPTVFRACGGGTTMQVTVSPGIACNGTGGTPAASATVTVKSLAFGPANLSIFDSANNQLTTGMIVDIPAHLALWPNPAELVFTALDTQTLTFQAQLVGNYTISAQADHPQCVSIVPHPQAFTVPGYTLTTVLFKVTVHDVCSGRIKLQANDGYTYQSAYYTVDNMIGSDVKSLTFLQTGASAAQNLNPYEEDYPGGTLTAKADPKPAGVVKISPPSIVNFKGPITVTPLKPGATNITISDSNGHTRVIPVSVTTTTGTIYLRGMPR